MGRPAGVRRAARAVGRVGRGRVAAARVTDGAGMTALRRLTSRLPVWAIVTVSLVLSFGCLGLVFWAVLRVMWGWVK